MHYKASSAYIWTKGLYPCAGGAYRGGEGEADKRCIHNDMAPQDTSSKLYQYIMALAEALPDIDPDDHLQAFPWMYLTDINPVAVLQNDERLFSQASAAMWSKALSHGIYMPVVLDDGVRL